MHLHAHMGSLGPQVPRGQQGGLGWTPAHAVCYIIIQKRNSDSRESTNVIESSKQACFFVAEENIISSFKVVHCSYNPEK